MSECFIDIIQLQRNVATARDIESYGKLFRHFHRPLTRFAAAIVKSNESAEEIYSDIMLKIWELGPALNNIENLQVYLFISVKHASLNYIAKYYKVNTIDIESIDLNLPYEMDPEQTFLQAELQRKIALAVKALPNKCQLVYKLIKEDGCSYREVAEILHISINTVEGHMTTALKKISQALRFYLHPHNN
ncbi:RNA polymerase sigma-70 factor [Chitinophaga japonensis]|uniref:RNA polymerase sigma-70 factor (ECF subfamily) n=1 Tax=Chitinophaga japonensis TaxID=104662 RepID=A0A562TFL8_CHIJA|nr:RNA polymerase sigma-70 factor [Chitinophaga japonensis]TWI92322.1 RNA polymerase sigma-70 factor (ECF subfamily) [Chitinophaga japonensis]